MELNNNQYQKLFESTKDCILILNANSGKIIDANPAFLELLGFVKEELFDKYIWDISPFKNNEYSKQLFSELQEKEYIRYSNLPLETVKGEKKHVEFVSNVYLLDGEKYIQCNIRDIAGQVKFEKTLSNSIDEKNELLNEIQHRTKNSFNMITSLISLKSDMAESTETKNILDELTYRVLSISELYTLLYETRSFDDVDVEIYCNKIIESMINYTNNIHINQKIESVFLSSKYASTIGMIIIELISNAIKYAFVELQKGIIDISLKKIDSQIVLKVKDNGVGFEEDFDMDKIESTGLNLVIMMVNQLSGSINFYCENGTEVIIRCPL